jgi:hypothetical protein
MPFSSNDPANYLAIGKQANRETEATTFRFLKYLNEAAFNPGIDSNVVYEGGDGQDAGLAYKQRVKPDGEVQVYSRPNPFVWLGAYAMGSALAVPSVAETGLASHCYVPNATVPRLTVEQSFAAGQEVERAMNAIAGGFKVESSAGEPWKVSVPIIGGGTYYGRPAASALTPVLDTGDPALHQGGAYLIDGATSLWIQGFTYDFTRKLDDGLFTVDVMRADVMELTRSLTLNMQVVMTDPTLYRKIVRQGGSFLGANLATGSFHAERALASSQIISLDVPLVRYTAVDLARLNPDGETVVLNISAQAIKGATSLTQIRGNIIGAPTSFLL